MNGPPFHRGGATPVGLPATHIDHCTGGDRMVFTPGDRRAALDEAGSVVQQRNSRLAARIAVGADDLDLDGVIAYVRRAADAHLDVPAPRAMQLVEALEQHRRGQADPA